MNRTTWLQDRRMQKFRDVLSRWEQGELSMMEAGEILGCSERQFRRYRDRYEDEGLSGLADKRLGKASAKRVPVDEVNWMLNEYRTHYLGWNVKHFHEHLQKRHGFSWGYSWTKTRGSFPNDEAAIKLLFLAIRNAGIHWRRPVEWTAAMGQFAILFEDRFPASAH